MSESPAIGQPEAGAGSGAGAALLAERRRQNLSLGDVSRQLKLSVRQVEALERDDYSGFQGPVFVHGFLRNYAKLLALDPNPLIRAADGLLRPAVVPVQESAPVAAGAGPRPAGGKSIWPSVAGVAVVLLVAGVVYVNMRGEPASKRQQTAASKAKEQVAAAPATGEKRQQAAKQADKPAPEKAGADRGSAEKSVAEKPAHDGAMPEKVTAEKRVEEKAAAASPSGEQATVAQDNAPKAIASAQAGETGPRMTVRMIFEQESWVEVKDRNGNIVFGQLNAAGTRRSASGEPPLSIVVGNAAGVRLFQGEKSIDLAPHTRVDVARLTLE